MAEGNKCNIIVLFLHQIVLHFCKINNQRLIYCYPESSSVILIFKRAALTRKIAFCCIPKMFCKLQCNIFKTKRIFIVCTPLGDGGRGGGRGQRVVEPFFRRFYIGGTQVKLGFWVGIGTLRGGDFFQVGLENSLYEKQ